MPTALEELKAMRGHMAEKIKVQIDLADIKWELTEYVAERPNMARGKTNSLGKIGDAFSKAKRVYKD
jgi:hypothetical protein